MIPQFFLERKKCTILRCSPLIEDNEASSKRRGCWRQIDNQRSFRSRSQLVSKMECWTREEMEVDERETVVVGRDWTR